MNNNIFSFNYPKIDMDINIIDITQISTNDIQNIHKFAFTIPKKTSREERLESYIHKMQLMLQQLRVKYLNLQKKLNSKNNVIVTNNQ